MSSHASDCRVRWTMDGFEMQCRMCRDWWPLSIVDGRSEFWDSRWGLRRCRACILATRRAYQSERYHKDPAYRAMKLESSRLTAWKDRVNRPEVVSERKAAYYDANRERICERERARYHRRKDAS